MKESGREREADPAAPITPSQIGIPLPISKKKKKNVCPLRCAQQLAARSPQLRCIAMLPLLLLQNMQSGGTAQVWYGTQGKRHRGTEAQQPWCRLQVHIAGAWDLGHNGDCDPSLNGSIGRGRGAPHTPKSRHVGKRG